MSTSILSRIFLILRAVFFASAFTLLWWWVATLVRPFDARLSFAIPHWLQPFGLVLAFLGALLDLWCVGTFVTRGRGTPAPFDPPREFVAAGPYRYVRNPMYLGAFGVILGAGLALPSPSIAGLSFAFLLLAHLFTWLYEEPSLGNRFGDPYRRYKSTVHRWLPRFSVDSSPPPAG